MKVLALVYPGMTLLDLVGNALDRLHGREQLRAGEALYGTMLESLPIGVFVCSASRTNPVPKRCSL